MADGFLSILTALLDGARTTLLLTAAAFLIGAPLGLLVAFGLVSTARIPRWSAALYRSVWRGTPILVQLLLIFYLLPTVGVVIPSSVAAVLALGLNTAAFQAEIYRAGLLAVPAGQIEAATMLGFSRAAVRRHIVVPHAVRAVLPPLTSEAILLLKNSSLVSIVAVTDLTRRAQQVASTNFRPLETYAAALTIYVALSIGLACLGLWLERRLRPARRTERQP